jgi:transcriptional regulator GlxA family with amidase domain
MRIAIVTFEGFNELDSLIAFAMLNRVKQPELKALITCPSERVTSMNGVVIQSQTPLSFAREAEAVIVGSGVHTRDLGALPACTDSKTKPWVEEAEVKVLDQPFVAHGNVATAGGCLGSHYLAAWVIARVAGWKAAESVVHYVAPVGQKREYVERALEVVGRYIPEQARVAV